MVRIFIEGQCGLITSQRPMVMGSLIGIWPIDISD
jgi:hypothetical protein